MFRWFIIFVETLALTLITLTLLGDKKFDELLQRLLNAIPSSSELKAWILYGTSIGAYTIVIILGIAVVGGILYYLVPYIGKLLNKDSLVEKWQREFTESKREEAGKIEQMKTETQMELQKAEGKNQELQKLIHNYQQLTQKVKQEREGFEAEFQQKRERYIKQLSDLQKQNKQLKGGLRRLKDKVKSYRAKLKNGKQDEKTKQPADI